MEILKALGVAYIAFSTILFTIFLLRFIGNIRKELTGKKNNKDTAILDKIQLVYVEQIDGAVYMYDKMTNNFLLQASTEDELWVKANEQFPKLKFFKTTKEADFSKDTK